MYIAYDKNLNLIGIAPTREQIENNVNQIVCIEKLDLKNKYYSINDIKNYSKLIDIYNPNKTK